jgi:ABC-2 type transport system ATP-binding protein
MIEQREIAVTVEEVLKVRGLTKRFKDVTAVADLNMVLYRGDVMGFIGPNGAGKTTTLRILATVLKPDSGEASVCGVPIENFQEVRASIGFMPDFFGVYDELLVQEYLEFFARAYHLPEHHRSFMVKEVLNTVQLPDSFRDRPISALSRGMKQRLGLARILLHDPGLLLLDEPAAGLDPRARVEFREIIRHLQARGKTIIVSSHILSDLADFCNKIGIIDGGRMIVFEETDQILKRLAGHRSMKLKILENHQRAKEVLEASPAVSGVIWDGSELRFSFAGGDEDLAGFLKALVLENVPVVTLGESTQYLEEIYMEVTRKGES